MKKHFILGMVLLSFSNFSLAESKNFRWTYKEDLNSDTKHVLEILSNKAGITLTEKNFIKIEERELANTHFTFLSQTVDGLPIRGQGVRIWKKNSDKNLVQVEASIELAANSKSKKFKALNFDLKTLKNHDHHGKLFSKVKEVIKSHEDNKITKLKFTDEWLNGELVRSFNVKTQLGNHLISISHINGKIVSKSYKEFPQADQYISLKTKVFPIYEEVESTHQILETVESELKYVHKKVHVSKYDPFEEMRERRYTEDFYNPLLALTVQGREQGYWSTSVLRNEATKIKYHEKIKKNTFRKNGGLILDGKYTSINIHPEAYRKFQGIKFDARFSANFMPDWVQGDDGKWELNPQGGLIGKPIKSDSDLAKIPFRDENHDPVKYLNDGFDEIQVYYAVTTFMESLNNMGFVDPDISTRQFHAFLYNPVIEYKDNAYYTEDTINFTTYSKDQPNMARDNSTIWHELGHGIMDRVMGEHLNLADTGGLSEGMADFVAQLVVQDQMKGQDFPGASEFRIINNTGFYLTNEVHDDGEAYGGTMRDIMVNAIKKFGPAGLTKITDLTFEAMRYCRNNPALTAQDWFSHMLFADEIGSKYRQPGEMKELIISSLQSRNFSMDGKAANMLISYNENVLTNESLGSRENPIKLKLRADEKVTYKMNVNLKEVDFYKFQYPVTVKVEFKKGALQGAINWEGETQNPLSYTINSAEEKLQFDLAANGKCDSINTGDGACKDYAYIQVFNNGSSKPSAKKRFYLRITTID